MAGQGRRGSPELEAAAVGGVDCLGDRFGEGKLMRIKIIDNTEHGTQKVLEYHGVDISIVFDADQAVIITLEDK